MLQMTGWRKYRIYIEINLRKILQFVDTQMSTCLSLLYIETFHKSTKAEAEQNDGHQALGFSISSSKLY